MYVQNIIFRLIYMYDVSTQGIDERVINVHYYYVYHAAYFSVNVSKSTKHQKLLSFAFKKSFPVLCIF